MLPTRNGSIRLFRFAGIEVFLHWSWFLIAVWQISNRDPHYSSINWNIAEYLALFGIVLMHEFGHSLACRSVGGMANQIILWPLGGVAYVAPPPRPGATLWSIAAGPLVNVALFPILSALAMLCHAWHWSPDLSDAQRFVYVIWLINCGLLVFNLLPVYPLDGGQILRSLLWFIVGPANSLMIASIIGMIGVGGLLLLAIILGNVWLGVLSAFVLINCGRGLLRSRAMVRLASAPRHAGFACPVCRQSPPMGAFWRCGKCGTAFDTFASGATCPNCGTQFPGTACTQCGSLRRFDEWCARVEPPPLPRN